MRKPVAVICLSMAGLFAGCAQKPLPQPVQVAPNPFGYLKRSAVCTTGPITLVPGGRTVEMKARSDDGQCAVGVSGADGDAYPSFLLTTLPVHGNSFIYNYNKETHVTYTADTAYAGPDSFTVSLVPGGGKPRTMLKVDISVDATGVPLPRPPVVAPPPPVAKKSTTHRRTHHVVHNQ